MSRHRLEKVRHGTGRTGRREQVCPAGGEIEREGLSLKATGMCE